MMRNQKQQTVIDDSKLKATSATLGKQYPKDCYSEDITNFQTEYTSSDSNNLDTLVQYNV